MKRILGALILTFIVFLAFGRSFAEELPWELSSEVGEISEKLISLFPKIEIYVVALDGDKVVLDNSKNKLSKGMVLSVFKAGKKYTHPTTGEVLGYTEELTGKVQVIDAQNSLAIAEVIYKDGKIERGQKGRISSGRLKILLSGIKNELKRKYQTGDFRSSIVRALEKSGRFEIIPMIDTYYSMKKHNADDIKKMQEHSFANTVAVDLKADILMECGLKKFGKTKFIEYKISMPGSEREFFRGSVNIRGKRYGHSPKERANLTVHTGQKGISLPGSSKRSQKLDYEIIGLRVGDVNGDGELEIVTTDGKKVRVYKKNETGVKLIWEESGSHYKQISVDLLDLNHNGVDEIYITRFKNVPRSYAIEYKNGAFNTIFEKFPRFFRVMITDKGKALFGQKMSGISVFYGSFEKYEYKNGLSVVDEIPVLSGKSIYGSAVGKVIENNDNIIYFDNSGRLEVYNLGGNKVWNSSERFGGTKLKIEAASKTNTIIDDRYGLLSDTGGKGKTWVKPRILVQDTDKNGVSELIVYKNFSASGSFLPNTPVFDKGVIYGLEYNGIGFGKTWFTSEVDAYIADFDLVGTQDEGYRLAVGLVLKNADLLSLGASKSMIVFYDVGNE